MQNVRRHRIGVKLLRKGGKKNRKDVAGASRNQSAPTARFGVPAYRFLSATEGRLSGEMLGPGGSF
jgi:hypothetical protein